jgi:predicted kinase
MSPVLVITRGLPASGKTTLARAWVAEDPENRIRVNRDDLRAMLHGASADWSPRAEKATVNARNVVITGALRRGLSVICDDTNLPANVVSDLRQLARREGAVIEIRDLTGVPLQTCLDRNALRTDKAPIPEEWMRRMHEKHIAPLTGTDGGMLKDYEQPLACENGQACMNHCGTGPCSRKCQVCLRLAFLPTVPCPACPDAPFKNGH